MESGKQFLNSVFLTASATLAVLYLTLYLLLHPFFMKFVQLTIDGAEVQPSCNFWN